MSEPTKEPTEHAYLMPRGEGVRCDVCGAVLTITLPMRLGDFANLLTAFAVAHRDCPAQPRERTDASQQ